MDELKEEKNYLLYSIIGVVLIIVSVFAVTLAFLSNKTSLSDKSMTVVKNDDLIVQYDKGTDINIGDIKPDKIIRKKFVVKNKSTGALNYDIKWVYTENNYENEKDLVYTLVANGKTHKQSKVPSTGLNIPILRNITIEKNMTHSYIINIKRTNGDRNKSNSFKGKIEVKLNKDSVKD